MKQSNTIIFIGKVIFIVLLVGQFNPSHTLAAPAAPVFTVNSLGDVPAGGTLTNGVCETGAGNGICTLRAALQKANAYPGGGVTINLPAGTYTRFSAYPSIAVSLTIQGSGAGKSIIDASTLDNGLYIRDNGVVLIDGVTIQHAGSAIPTSSLQGLYNQGTVTFQNGQIVDSTEGGVYNDGIGIMTISNTSILRNKANNYESGGIYNVGARLTVINSLIAYNYSAKVTGGVAIFNGVATIINSTISNNTSTNSAGGLSVDGANSEVDLFNSTIAGNVVDYLGSNPPPYGAGIQNSANSIVHLKNTLLAHNYAGTYADDCFGSVISADYNWLPSSVNCTVTGAQGHNIFAGDTMLEELRDNGGPTLTRALLAGSPALDHIPAAQCTDQVGALLMTDQRGLPRPVNALCDIGAFEGSLPVGMYLRNLIRNGDAETSAGGISGAQMAVPYWTTTGFIPTSVQYDSPGGFPTQTDPGPADRGQSFFAGGYASNSSPSSMQQSIDLSAIAAAIDTGRVRFSLSAYLGGYANQQDNAQIQVTFQDGLNAAIGQPFTAGPTTAAERAYQTKLIFKETHNTIPPNARSVTVQITMTCGCINFYNDGYADNASLVLTPQSAYLPFVRH